jgi:hypothetical protein
VTDAGGVVVEILGSKGGGAVAKSDVDAWVNTYKLPVTTVKDAPGGTGSISFFGIRETCVIVDVKTMKIVKKINGSVAGAGTSSVGQLVPEILKLLASG